MTTQKLLCEKLNTDGFACIENAGHAETYNTAHNYGGAAVLSRRRIEAVAPALLKELEVLVENNYGQPSGVTVPALDPARDLIAAAKGGD